MGGKVKRPDDKRLGNQFWKVRSSHGHPFKYENKEDLLSACYEYFDWVNDNPLKEQRAFHAGGGEIAYAELNKMRAMTITGLCVFLGITHKTWYSYKNRPEMRDAIEHVEQVIRTQKMEGAAAELLNHQIIARDLGLTDKKDVNLTTTLEDLVAEEDGEQGSSKE